MKVFGFAFFPTGTKSDEEVREDRWAKDVYDRMDPLEERRAEEFLCRWLGNEHAKADSIALLESEGWLL